jgi:hypothetical protein
MLTSKKITFESHVYSNMEHGSGLLGPDWPTEAVRLLNKLNPTVAIAVLRSPAVLPGIDTSYKKSVGSMTSVHVEDMYDLLGRNARNAPAAVQTYGIRVIK